MTSRPDSSPAMSNGSAQPLPPMVAYWDKDLKCRFANAAYEDWFGVDPARLPGRHIRDLLGSELFTLNEPYVGGALSGKLQVFQRTLRAPDGTLHDSLAHYVPDLASGSVGGFTVQVTEVAGSPTSCGANSRGADGSDRTRAPADRPAGQLAAARVRGVLQGVVNSSSLLRRHQGARSLTTCLAVIDDACTRIPALLDELEDMQHRTSDAGQFYTCRNGHVGALWHSENAARTLALARGGRPAVMREMPGRIGRGYVCGICGSKMTSRAEPGPIAS